MSDRDDWPNAPPSADSRAQPPQLAASRPWAKKQRFALGRLKSGQMNKSEAAYSVHLEALKYASRILWWKFEGIKLRLGDNTFLTVDFAVMQADGTLEMHEVKGFMEDDANTKLKIAADLYPFRFFLVKTRLKRDGGGWDVKEIGNAG